MRIVETKSVPPGTILAKTIYNGSGQILLHEGVELQNGMLQRLTDLNILYIYIRDERTADLHHKESIPRELKEKAIKTIEATFQEIDVNSSVASSIVLEKVSTKFVDTIRQLLHELKSNEELLSLLSDVLTYDDYIFSHSYNVTLYSLAIGIELGLTQKELETLGLGAILHDVGKINIPEEILLKPGKLTEEEFEVVKEHSEAGFELLKSVHNLSLLVAHCAYQHHERLNGSGYPRGIKGDEIHLFGKIIAVADVFDAVTSNRIYRKAMLPHNGLEILFAGTGALFEEKIVNAFRRSVVIYPIGMTVELSNGLKGVVSNQNQGVCDRPIIRILEENGQPVTPYELDLLKKLSVVITNCDTTFQKV